MYIYDYLEHFPSPKPPDYIGILLSIAIRGFKKGYILASYCEAIVLRRYVVSSAFKMWRSYLGLVPEHYRHM
jgi:hypothetical protein